MASIEPIPSDLGWLYYAESTNGVGHLVRAQLFGELAARLGLQGGVRRLVSPWSALPALEGEGFAWTKLRFNEIDADSDASLTTANRREWLALARVGSWEGLVVDGLPRWDLTDGLPAGTFPRVVAIGRGRTARGAAECLARSAAAKERLVAVIHRDGSREAAIWEKVAKAQGWEHRIVGPLFRTPTGGHAARSEGAALRLLITTGGGGPNPTRFRLRGEDDTREFVLGALAACARVNERVPLEVWVQVGPNFRDPSHLLSPREGDRLGAPTIVRFLPRLHERWGEFDRVVGLCGYNTFHELLSARVPSLLFYRPYSSEVFDERIGRASETGFMALSPLVPDRHRVGAAVSAWLLSAAEPARGQATLQAADMPSGG